MVTARFILTSKGVIVRGFKARLSELESLNVLALLTSDLVEICYEMTLGKLKPSHVRFANQATACKCSLVARADSAVEADQKVDNILHQL
jgi:phosphoribosylamine-glycine ligase